MNDEIKKILNNYKKIYDPYEIKKFIQSFDRLTVKEGQIRTPEMFSVNFGKVKIEAEEDNFIFRGQGFAFTYIFYNKIKYISQDEVDNGNVYVSIKLDAGTQINFVYED